MILILAAPRTGSSLVAHIFHEHGVWIGDVKGNNGFDYKVYENLELRSAVINIAKREWKGKTRVWGKPIPANKINREVVAKVVEEIRPKEPWLYKTAVDYAGLFFQFDPQLIFIRRDPEQAIKSLVSKGKRRDKKIATEAHNRRMDLMEQYHKEKGGVWVNTDELLEGNYKTIKAAIESVGLKFDPKIVDRIIDKKKWHFNRSQSTSASQKGSRKSKDSQKKASSKTQPTQSA